MARKPALEPWSAAGLTRDAHVHSAKAGRTQPEQSSDPLRTHSNEQVGSETALAEEAQVTPQNPADTASSWRTMEATTANRSAALQSSREALAEPQGPAGVADQHQSLTHAYPGPCRSGHTRSTHRANENTTASGSAANGALTASQEAQPKPQNTAGSRRTGGQLY